MIGLLGILVAASALAAADNLVVGTSNPPPAAVPGADEAIEKEYKKLLETDDAAQAEVDKWIQENDEAATKGAGVPSADLQHRIRDRFAPIR